MVPRWMVLPEISACTECGLFLFDQGCAFGDRLLRTCFSWDPSAIRLRVEAMERTKIILKSSSMAVHKIGIFCRIFVGGPSQKHQIHPARRVGTK